MSPQLQAGWTRGLIETLVVAAATAGQYAVAHILTGDTTKSVVVGAIGAACNFVIARATEGHLDGLRAARVARGDDTALARSDVGYTLAKMQVARMGASRLPLIK